VSSDIFFFYSLGPLTLQSLASGQFGTYETISSWAFLYAAGLGNVEYSITVSFILPLNSVVVINMI
jgi:hypothetical protein